jgi:hypothetical protein
VLCARVIFRGHWNRPPNIPLRSPGRSCRETMVNERSAADPEEARGTGLANDFVHSFTNDVW